MKMLIEPLAVAQESLILKGILVHTHFLLGFNCHLALRLTCEPAGGGRRWVSAAVLTITNLHSASQCLPNTARGAEHTVAGCRYQCYQRRGSAGAPSAAAGARPRRLPLFASCRYTCSARECDRPVSCRGKAGEMNSAKEKRSAAPGQSRRETVELFFGAWLQEGHDWDERLQEHYTSVGRIAVAGHWHCSGPSSLPQQNNTKLITQQWLFQSTPSASRISSELLICGWGLRWWPSMPSMSRGCLKGRSGTLEWFIAPFVSWKGPL